MENPEIKLAAALAFFNSEKKLYGDAFEANDCLEDIHRIYGLETRHAVRQSIKQKYEIQFFNASPLGKFVNSL
jgi:hypothetical protein